MKLNYKWEKINLVIRKQKTPVTTDENEMVEIESQLGENRSGNKETKETRVTTDETRSFQLVECNNDTTKSAENKSPITIGVNVHQILKEITAPQELSPMEGAKIEHEDALRLHYFGQADSGTSKPVPFSAEAGNSRKTKSCNEIECQAKNLSTSSAKSKSKNGKYRLTFFLNSSFEKIKVTNILQN